MIKERKQFLYRCVFCDKINGSDDPRAVIYCEHKNGLKVMMTRRPIKLKHHEGKGQNNG